MSKNKQFIAFNLPYGNAHLIDENIETIINEVKCDANILKSIEPQNNLNERIWDNDTFLLNSRVRLRLLEIADAFFDSLDIDWVDVDDIILTGSLCNYNWSKYSDFDIHLIIDFKKVDDRVDFVANYFNAKKKLWNNEHEGLKIYGFPVELYVQDKNETHTSSGIYSLEKNTWIVKPNKESFMNISINKDFIRKKCNDIIDIIDNMEKQINKENEDYDLLELSKKIKKLFDKIKALRKHGLKNEGEYSSYNIIFKVLRRMDYIEKLYNMKINIYDKLKSLE